MEVKELKQLLLDHKEKVLEYHKQYVKKLSELNKQAVNDYIASHNIDQCPGMQRNSIFLLDKFNKTELIYNDEVLTFCNRGKEFASGFTLTLNEVDDVWDGFYFDGENARDTYNSIDEHIRRLPLYTPKQFNMIKESISNQANYIEIKKPLLNKSNYLNDYSYKYFNYDDDSITYNSLDDVMEYVLSVVSR